MPCVICPARETHPPSALCLRAPPAAAGQALPGGEVIEEFASDSGVPDASVPLLCSPHNSQLAISPGEEYSVPIYAWFHHMKTFFVGQAFPVQTVVVGNVNT